MPLLSKQIIICTVRKRQNCKLVLRLGLVWAWQQIYGQAVPVKVRSDSSCRRSLFFYTMKRQHEAQQDVATAHNFNINIPDDGERKLFSRCSETKKSCWYCRKCEYCTSLGVLCLASSRSRPAAVGVQRACAELSARQSFIDIWEDDVSHVFVDFDRAILDIF